MCPKIIIESDEPKEDEVIIGAEYNNEGGDLVRCDCGTVFIIKEYSVDIEEDELNVLLCPVCGCVTQNINGVDNEPNE